MCQKSKSESPNARLGVTLRGWKWYHGIPWAGFHIRPRTHDVSTIHECNQQPVTNSQTMNSVTTPSTSICTSHYSERGMTTADIGWEAQILTGMQSSSNTMWPWPRPTLCETFHLFSHFAIIHIHEFRHQTTMWQWIHCFSNIGILHSSCAA